MTYHKLDELDEDLIEITYVFAAEDYDQSLTGQIPFEDWKMAIDDWSMEFEALNKDTDWEEVDYSEAIEDFTLKKIYEMLDDMCPGHADRKEK